MLLQRIESKMKIKQEFNQTSEEVVRIQKQCRICLEVENCQNLIVPCKCLGTLQYVHEECLKMWIEKKRFYSCGNIVCELCKQTIEYKVKFEIECRKCQDIQLIYKERTHEFCAVLIAIPISSGFFGYLLYLLLSVLKDERLIEIIVLALVITLFFVVTTILLVKLISEFLMRKKAVVDQINDYRKIQQPIMSNSPAKVFPQTVLVDIE